MGAAQIQFPQIYPAARINVFYCAALLRADLSKTANIPYTCLLKRSLYSLISKEIAMSRGKSLFLLSFSLSYFLSISLFLSFFSLSLFCSLVFFLFFSFFLSLFLSPLLFLLQSAFAINSLSALDPFAALLHSTGRTLLKVKREN